jgi:hypothetical protein
MEMDGEVFNIGLYECPSKLAEQAPPILPEGERNILDYVEDYVFKIEKMFSLFYNLLLNLLHNLLHNKR